MTPVTARKKILRFPGSFDQVARAGRNAAGYLGQFSSL